MPRRPISEPRQAALAVAAALLLGSCGGGKSPSPPGVGAPGNGITPDPNATRVTGSERLAWSQAGDASNLRFRAYVDGAAVELESATCAESPDPDCSAPLPALTNGIHTIAVATVASSGAESASSPTITVEKVSATGTALGLRPTSDAAARTVAPLDGIVTAPDGQQFSVETMARALRPPLQLAAVPDGRLLVSEGDGRISVLVPDEPERNALAIDTAQVFGQNASGVAGLAVHPEFSSNHLVYLSLLSPDGTGARLRIVRLREVGGLLGEPATVFEAPVVTASGTATPESDAVPAAPSARLAFGPDGLLYAMLSPGMAFNREPAASTPLASIVRIDGDGHPSSAGPLDGVAASPLGLAWHPATNELLAVFPSAGGAVSIASLEPGNRPTASAAAALVPQPQVDGSWSAGQLRFDVANDSALTLGRAFVDELRRSRSAAVRLAVPVAIDGLLGPWSGELMDVVAAAGTAYVAVTASSAAEQAGEPSALILRLRLR